MKGDVRDEIRMIIAGGGTGGHLFPGLTIGKEVVKRYKKAEIVFITGSRRFETDIISRHGFKQESIHIEGLKGQGWKGAIRSASKIPLGLFQSVRIIKRFLPHIVFGMGGYSSGPACLAARIMGVPTAVHEQNSFPGLTNRILSRIVDKVFISFEESREYFPEGRVYLTGNPVREELLGIGGIDEGPKERFSILVMGGSQGASAINKAFVDALEILKLRGEDPLVTHQTGEQDYKTVLAEYNRKGLEGEILPFIDDMGAAYKKAHIVVNRAGATTVSELAALGKPSILIPYPYAANRHQETNARILAREGGAVVISQDELDGNRLADILMTFMGDRKAIIRMGERARKVGRPEATQLIANEIAHLAFGCEN